MERPYKIVVADGSEEFSKMMSNTLKLSGAFEVVGIAADGVQAKEMLIQLRPDVMVLDLMLTKLDGISVLKFASTMDRMPITIVTSTFVTDYAASMCAKLGAKYFMLKPCECSAIVDRIREACANNDEKIQREATNSIEVMITAMIHDLGVPAHIKGYQYLREAIKLAFEDISVMEAVTKGLYPMVAETFSTTSSRVERAIRHAIEVAWERGDLDAQRNIFGYTVCENRTKPTNAEFITSIADKLQMKLKNAKR